MAEPGGWDVFISHENSDGPVALELAARLRAAGYRTWCYEDDSGVGSYLVQIDRAIEGSRAMVVIVSPKAMRSPHVRNEIVRAYESQKRFIPIRLGLAHEDILRAEDDDDDERRREWRMAFGASVSLQWDADDPESVAAKVAEGLRRQGVFPAGPVDPNAIPEVRPVRRTDPNSQRRSQRPGDFGIPADMPAFQELLRAPMTRMIAAGVVGALGALFNGRGLLSVIAPGGDVADVINRFVPLMRLLNLVASGAGLWLSIRMARAAWQMFHGTRGLEHEVRATARLMLALIGGWFCLALFVSVVGVPTGMESMRGLMQNGIIGTTVLTGAQAGIVYYLYRPAAEPALSGAAGPGPTV